MLSTDFRAGCPVLAVAVEEPSGEQRDAVDAAAEVFTAWETLLADALRRHGATDVDAGRLATLTVAAVEGSVAMCRAKRDIRPLDEVAASLEALLSAAVKA